jgi:dTDP-glucose 4,6-dehydratase
MKRILITGAAILGSHLCDRFINEGYFVLLWITHYR